MSSVSFLVMLAIHLQDRNFAYGSKLWKLSGEKEVPVLRVYKRHGLEENWTFLMEQSQDVNFQLTFLFQSLPFLGVHIEVSLDVLILISVHSIKGWGLYFLADSCSCTLMSPKQTNHLGSVATPREQRNVTTQAGHQKGFPGKISLSEPAKAIPQLPGAQQGASHCSPDI